jgi:hypothetical protein
MARSDLLVMAGKICPAVMMVELDGQMYRQIRMAAALQLIRLLSNQTAT